MISRSVGFLAAVVLGVFVASAAYAMDFSPTLSLSVGEAYNDNIFLTKDDKVDDFITYITPGIDIQARSEVFDLRLSYFPTFSIYASNSEQNNTAQDVRFDGLAKITPKFDARLRAGYLQSQDVTNFAAIPQLGPISTNQRTEVLSFLTDVTYRFSSQLSLTLGVDYFNYSTDATDSNDSKTWTGRAVLSYMLGERTTLSANATVSKIDYEVTGDSTNQAYTLGINYRLGPTVTVYVNGGIAITKIDVVDKTDTGFSGGAGITKTFDRGSASLTFTQAVIPATDTSAPVNSQIVTFNFNMPFGQRFVSGVSASYAKYKTVGDITLQDNDEFRAGADLNYFIAPWASVGLTYTFLKHKDNLSSLNDYTNNIALLMLRLSYSKKATSGMMQAPISWPSPLSL